MALQLCYSALIDGGEDKFACFRARVSVSVFSARHRAAVEWRQRVELSGDIEWRRLDKPVGGPIKRRDAPLGAR